MRLKRNSLLVRWAYLVDNTIYNNTSPGVRYSWKLPETTSVCSIFWRSILLTPLAILIAVPSVMVGMLVIIIIGGGSLIRDIYMWVTRKEGSQWVGDKTDEVLGVIGEGFKSIYKKACPLVNIDD